MKRIRENALALTVILTLIGLAFGAWFAMGSEFTSIETHELLAYKHEQLSVRVEQTAFRVEELKAKNDLRDYQYQLKFCKPKNSETCVWLQGKVDALKKLLEDIQKK